jgi:hypothetical protein
VTVRGEIGVNGIVQKVASENEITLRIEDASKLKEKRQGLTKSLNFIIPDQYLGPGDLEVQLATLMG